MAMNTKFFWNGVVSFKDNYIVKVEYEICNYQNPTCYIIKIGAYGTSTVPQALIVMHDIMPASSVKDQQR